MPLLMRRAMETPIDVTLRLETQMLALSEQVAEMRADMWKLFGQSGDSRVHRVAAEEVPERSESKSMLQ